MTAKQKKRNIQPNRLASSKQKDTVQKGMQKTAKVIEGKLKRLEVVTKPDQISKVRFTLPQTLELHNSYPVMGDKVTVMRGKRTLLKDASFQFANGQKIAVVGQNGVGKTTLFEQILENQAGIILSPKVVFSAYQQLDYQLDSDWSLLRFIEKRSDYSE
ncbi:ATP-binding cassette domain-containing protein [Levilactobacillus namurensis]|uniref:ATP-binding cassette domain-containing protein n=1 Tax=Levilactobacillus namurensis TaxID=380393 RepID=UPI0036F38B2A